MCNGARDAAARRAVRERFLSRSTATTGDANANGSVARKRKASEVDAKANAEEAASAEEAAANVGDEAATNARAVLDANGYRCECCDVKCGSAANYASHVGSKRHRRNADAARGRSALAALKRAKIEAREGN